MGKHQTCSGRLVPCGWSGTRTSHLAPPLSTSPGGAIDPEDALLKDPSRADIMLAIWSTLALTDAEDEFLGTDLGQEALSELFDDLHRDLQYADILMDEEFEEWAIAIG